MNTQLDNIIKKWLSYDNIDASTIKLNLKTNIAYVDTSCQAIINRFQYYETILGSDIKLFTKSYTVNTYTKTDVKVALSILQAGIDRRVGINVVDIDGTFKIHGVPNDILRIQKVDGSTLYDALELSFNSID